MSAVLDRIRPFLNDVKNPAQYVGGEWNQVVKDPGAVRVRAAIAFPDVYEVGMSHLGVKILYGVMNALDFVWGERVFAPWTDMADELRRRRIPLGTLESHTPLAALDVVGFSLQSELTYSNVLLMLDLGGVPLLAAERDAGHPLVIAGGSGATHPEPLADFVDVFLVGDGEEALAEFLTSYDELKQRGAGRAELLLEIARRHDFCYVPRFYAERRDAAGAYLGLEPLAPGLPLPVRAAAVADFENAYFPTSPVVPAARVVQDRIVLEIMRGCARSCRFCQAGMLKRPIRFRSTGKLLEQALATYRNTGYDEVSLQSLSSGDYPGIEKLMAACDEEFAAERIGLALPSLRVTQQLALLPGRMKSVRKSGLTMAPEVATDELRRTINKEIRNQDLYATAAAAFENGWDLVKLYFMIGNPGESPADVAAIYGMADEVSRLRRRVTGKGNARVNVTVSTFVPKPFTPFQWAKMLGIDEIRERQDLLRRLNKNRRVRINFHHAESSTLEGILSRGGREMGRTILAAYERGARFDAWDECFRAAPWWGAFDATGVDPQRVIQRDVDPDRALPWDHVAPGVDKAFLAREWQRAQRAEGTQDCFGTRCNRCGVDPRTCFHIKRTFARLAAGAAAGAAGGELSAAGLAAAAR